MSNTNHNDQACTHRVVVVQESELPFSCPQSDERVWDAHPRVYLPIEVEGKVMCPYCSTQYILERADKSV